MKALATQAARSFTADATVAVLDRLVHKLGRSPEHVRMDNGPELTAHALTDWCRYTGVDPAYIDPGSPWQNGVCESFNGRFRDEFLTCEQFNTLLDNRWTTNRGPVMSPLRRWANEPFRATHRAPRHSRAEGKLRDRVTPHDDEITRETHVSTLATLWLDEIIAAERVTPQTVSRYEISVRVSIVPALGNLRIRETGAGRLDKFRREIAKDRPAAAKGAKVVLGQMFALAVRRGALTGNPVRDTGRLRAPRRKVLALQTGQLDGVRFAIRKWQQPTPGKSGPRPTSDLGDIVDLMLATGARIGEILALRWKTSTSSPTAQP